MLGDQTRKSSQLLQVRPMVATRRAANLEGDVGYLLTQQLQAAPRALMQEAQSHIKGGAPPHLQGSSILHDV